jgi:hypothetical protein
MDQIPTAEDFLLNAGFPGHAKHGLAKKWMIEFAKLHVEVALKEASQQAKCCDGAIVNLGFEIISATVEKDSILNAYPLENIK